MISAQFWFLIFWRHPCLGGGLVTVISAYVMLVPRLSARMEVQVPTSSLSALLLLLLLHLTSVTATIFGAPV